ncbi:hypothetical protein HNI00_21910 [Thermoleptolyngbya oregonensis NK1-22]|uniref:Uncharacterized protein n=1 Tax=Thermoleptolyngbya oregonensis NK1-22 TaxID=2547457 RepID=A0AA97BAY7_9CYAN|nr:hypothetical protein [Thermoleptolyngbya oregonensis]WOB45490.1 hypothetical protein HNI00_21910 [Thermoleptolyngbya oregonensis NK1-22]
MNVLNARLLGSAIGALITATAIIPPEAIAPASVELVEPVEPVEPLSNNGSTQIEIIPGNGFYWLRGYSYVAGQPPQIPPVPVGAMGVVYDATGRCIGRFEQRQFVFLDADSVQCVGIPPAPPVVYQTQTAQGGQG